MFPPRGSSRRPAGATVGLTALLSVVLLAGAGCTARGAGESTGTNEARTVDKIAIVTPEKESDHGWNQQGLEAAQKVADGLGIELEKVSNVGYDNTETILTQVAKDDVDFVIAHASGFATAGARVATKTKVPTLVDDVPSNVPGEVATLMTRANEGGYLAGIAAAKTTQTKTVSIVISADDPNWFMMSGGFAAGVHSVDPAVTVILGQIGPAEYADSAGGKRVATQAIAAGADVLFGMGDGATIGYLQAVEAADVGHKVWYIGAIGDLKPIDNKGIVLTSVLWNFAGAYQEAIKDIEAGTFGEHDYTLTVENGGIALQESADIPTDTWTEIEAAKAKIISGEIEVPLATTKDAVNELLSATQ